MTRCLYHASIHEFLQLSPEALLGTFVDNYHGVAMTTTNEAWADEIRIMQEVLLPWKDEDGQVIFEYDIPRLKVQAYSKPLYMMIPYTTHC